MTPDEPLCPQCEDTGVYDAGIEDWVLCDICVPAEPEAETASTDAAYPDGIVGEE